MTMTYRYAWRKLDCQLKKSLKHYAEEAHHATIKGDKTAQAKWDERGNALQILKNWFDILDKECKETERANKQEIKKDDK